MVLGNEQDSVGGGWQATQHFTGVLDEVRISNTARTAEYADTTYNNQANQGTGTDKFIKTKSSEETQSTGASWAKNQDTKYEDFPYETLYRLRFEVSNEGGQSSGGVTYQLQVAETGTCASGSYSAVPTDTSGDWQIAGSTYITDGESTQNVNGGLDDEATTFVAGELKDTGNTTGSITLDSDEFTEIEFAVQATTNATNGGNYCFRLYDTTGGEALDTYTKYPEAVVVPENLWLFLPVLPFILKLVKRKRVSESKKGWS